MKRLLVLLTVTAVPALANAQGAPPPPPPPGGGGGMGMAPGPAGPAPGVGTVWFGGSFEAIVGGSVEEAAGGMSASNDLNSTFAINGVIEYQMSDVLAIGLMPRYVFGTRPTNDSNTGDDATMLDIRGRVSAGTWLQPQIRGYGFGALGYSIIYLPSSVSGGADNPAGLTLTFGAGASYAINPRTRLFAEGGYEFGFQSTSVMGTNVDFKVKIFELGAGVQFALGGAGG